MAAIAPQAVLTAQSFREALTRAFPGLDSRKPGPVALIALLDDGSLRTVAQCGHVPTETDVRSLQSDEAWAALVRALNGSDDVEVLVHADRTLVPVMLGSLLYGALEWQGACEEGFLPHEAPWRASEEFLPAVIQEVQGSPR